MIEHGGMAPYDLQGVNPLSRLAIAFRGMRAWKMAVKYAVARKQRCRGLSAYGLHFAVCNQWKLPYNQESTNTPAVYDCHVTILSSFH